MLSELYLVMTFMLMCLDCEHNLGLACVFVCVFVSMLRAINNEHVSLTGSTWAWSQEAIN